MALGFAVGAGGLCEAGTVKLWLGAPAWGWSVRGLADGEIDGLPTSGSSAPPREPAPEQPNGVTGLDHVVVATPDLQRTLGALQAAGLELRRVRDAGPERRQGFFRVGEALLEVVGPAQPAVDPGAAAARPAAFWGVTFVVDDLATTADRLGPALGASADAVQPGRRIATVRRGAGLGIPVAFITSHPHRTGPPV